MYTYKFVHMKAKNQPFHDIVPMENIYHDRILKDKSDYENSLGVLENSLKSHIQKSRNKKVTPNYCWKYPVSVFVQI